MHRNINTINDSLKEAYHRIGTEIIKHPSRLKTIASEKQVIKFQSNNAKYIYYLILGEVELINSFNDLVVANINSPGILGLSSMYADECLFYSKTVTNSELIAIPLDDLMVAIDHESLWKDISIIISYHVQLYYVRDLLISQANVYNIIKGYLEMLWSMSADRCGIELDANSISVFDFILSRTQISRSSLNKVLKDLSSGGYIQIHRGKLISLNKLPPGY